MVETENAEPPEVSDDACAPGSEPASAIGTACQSLSEIDPRWPPVVVAAASVKVAVPKSASGTGVQPEASHVDGASAIHSADETSMSSVRSVRSNERPVVVVGELDRAPRCH